MAYLMGNSDCQSFFRSTFHSGIRVCLVGSVITLYSAKYRRGFIQPTVLHNKVRNVVVLCATVQYYLRGARLKFEVEQRSRDTRVKGLR